MFTVESQLSGVHGMASKLDCVITGASFVQFFVVLYVVVYLQCL